MTTSVTSTNTTLRHRWLQAMRASTTRAIGRECDYARAEGDVDRFDPIGLLALAYGDTPEAQAAVTGWIFRPGATGAYYDRRMAKALALQVGFPPDKLAELCELNDMEWTMADLADWCEAQR